MTNNQLSVENPIVTIEDLKVYFPVRRGVFSKEVGQVKAVDGVSIQIKRRDIRAGRRIRMRQDHNRSCSTWISGKNLWQSHLGNWKAQGQTGAME